MLTCHPMTAKPKTQRRQDAAARAYAKQLAERNYSAAQIAGLLRVPASRVANWLAAPAPPQLRRSNPRF